MVSYLVKSGWSIFITMKIVLTSTLILAKLGTSSFHFDISSHAQAQFTSSQEHISGKMLEKLVFKNTSIDYWAYHCDIFIVLNWNLCIFWSISKGSVGNIISSINSYSSSYLQSHTTNSVYQGTGIRNFKILKLIN